MKVNTPTYSGIRQDLDPSFLLDDEFSTNQLPVSISKLLLLIKLYKVSTLQLLYKYVFPVNFNFAIYFGTSF